MKFIRNIAATVCAAAAVFAFTACDYACAKGHTYGDWTVVTEATCTLDGERVRTCSVCGNQQTQEIEKLGHDFGDFVYSEEEGTSEGELVLVKAKYCSRCDAVDSHAAVENGIAVHNATEFKAAVATNGAYVVLMNDIAEAGTTDFNIRPADADLEVTVNFNGHNLGGELNVCTTFSGTSTDMGKKLTVKLLNGSIGTESGYIAGEETDDTMIWYGILVNGIGVNLTVENITTIGYYGGFYTNGVNSGSTISFKNSVIKSAAANGNGSYLAGGHTVTFDDCTFEGGSGLYIKSGKVTLNNCTVKASAEYVAPTFNGNGADGEGSGIIIDSANYNIKSLTFVMNGGSITSLKGYALEQVVTQGDNYSTSTLNQVTLTAGKTPAVFAETAGAVTVNE